MIITQIRMNLNDNDDVTLSITMEYPSRAGVKPVTEEVESVMDWDAFHRAFLLMSLNRMGEDEDEDENPDDGEKTVH